MTWHHVAALLIAALMVVMCARYLSNPTAAAGGGQQMFFAVVQLAGTIAAGVAGMALGPGRDLRRRRHTDLTPSTDRPKLGHPPKD